ncbi:Maspardin, partial [Galemys pyrenaicus]
KKRERRESLVLASNSPSHHGDRSNHAAPPLPHDVTPPLPNPEARFGRRERGGPGSLGRAPRPSEAGPPACPRGPLRLRVLSAAAARQTPVCCLLARTSTGGKSRRGEKGRDEGAATAGQSVWRLHLSLKVADVFVIDEYPPSVRLVNGELIMGEIKVSPDYNWFRSTVPLKKIIVDDDDSKIWSLYDAGPRNIRCPLIFLPPVSGTADVFFRQILALTGWGYRVIALQYPVYWDHLEFCDGFRKLLDHLQLDKVHLFGASLGGFLAQKFAEYTHKSPRVHSLILCNSFSDTSIFNQTWTANSFWLMPSFMLKKIVLGNFSSGPVDPMMADAIDFMVDRLESLGQSELASRLTLNCQNSYVEPHKIRDIPVTIMDVFDQSALSTEAKEEMYKLYPNARRAHLKTGGNFPYLCRSAEVNLYVQIHLLQFHGTKYAAIDPSMVSAEELEVQKSNLGISEEEQ